MRHIIITVALVGVALVITFGVGAMLEQATFRAGPEPSAGLPAGSPVPADRPGRRPLRPHEA